MKKLIAFLLAATMLIGIAACGTEPAETTPNSTTTEEPAVQPTETTTQAPEPTETTASEQEETTPAETTTETPDVPVAPTPTFDESKIVLSFAAISDTQHRYSGIDTLGKFKTALRQLKAYAEETAGSLDAVLFAGDLVQSATTAEVQEFKGAYEEVMDVTEVPLVFALGNHDVKLSYTVEDLNTESFYNIFGNAYRTYDEATSDLSLGCTHTVINNYHFLCINPITESYSGSGDSGVLYSDEVKTWLDETLAAITTANPDHYVFVNTHPIPYDTAYGSLLVTNGGTRWYTKDLTAILEKYNQVVTFGGHIHFPLNDPRSIMQTAFTSLGCASVTYMAIENGSYEDMKSETVMKDCAEFSQGLLCQIDENGNMRITRMDFYNETTIEKPWIISAPVQNGAHLLTYGKDRAENNTAPVLSTVEAVMANVLATGKQRVMLEIAAATDDEFVHHYEITFVDKTNQTTKTYKILADFYRHADSADMKESYSLNLGFLSPATDYEATVVAYDSWDAASEPVTCAFQITGVAPEA